MILGLTGGIASGKSTASKILRKLGWYIIDADKISHEISSSTEVIEKVRQSFGEEAILNEQLNRKKLREIIFKEREKRELLNNIMHPIIVKKIENEIKENKDKKLIILDIPLLFETKLEYMCDKILVIWIEEKLQIERIMKRDKTTFESAKKIVESQMKLSEKLEKSDIEIENSGTIKELEEKIKKILEVSLKKN
jgi:dephospho-CoA kinase